jgi:hypothetical protein
MKRIIVGVTAALALALVGTARADDTQSSESKSTVKKSDPGTMKTEKKSTSDKVEKKATSDVPGTATSDLKESDKALKQEKTAPEPTTPIK